MGLKGLACIAAVAIAATAVVPTAEAQTRKQQAAPSSQNTVFITRDENGRTATRVIVTPRSYLDGGTEVLPGQRKFNHRDMEPYWSPIDILGPGKTYERQPLQPAWNSWGTRCCF
jgi:hypothetical protein